MNAITQNAEVLHGSGTFALGTSDPLAADVRPKLCRQTS